jgi:hypothetical protein
MHQRMAVAATPPYLQQRGRPQHPRESLEQSCMRGRFAGGALVEWIIGRDEETVHRSGGASLVQIGGATDPAVDAAAAGLGIVLCSRIGRGRASVIACSSLCRKWVAELDRPQSLLSRPEARARAAAGLRGLIGNEAASP